MNAPNDPNSTQVQSVTPVHLFQPDGLPVVSGFILLAEIGRGGMGVVYRARDTALHRDVAVKVLQDRYPSDGPAAQRFIEESQITSQLQHPGVPPIHQVGALADRRPFLVMKLIKGDTLDKLLKERKTPADNRGRFVAAFEQVCQSVGYAHAHNVIHRDLKPDNIMVGAFGEVQVMDWGLSKSLRDTRPADALTTTNEPPRTAIGSLRDPGSGTQAGSVMGTPAFMPPEQAGGEIAKIDARSDVFSLGAVLCVILTGEPPYVGGSGDAVQLMAIRARLGDALARLDACDAEPELVALCKRCLSVEPGDRPTDANELASVVASFRSAAEERARQAELNRVRAEGERAKFEAEAREQRKRRRVLVASTTAVAAVLIAGVLGTTVGFVRAEYRREEEERAREREAQQRRIAEENEQKAVANLRAASRAVDDCYNVVAENPLLKGDAMKPVRRLLYEVALGYYRGFTQQTPDDPTLLAEYARNLERVVDITQALGSQMVALEACDELLRAREKLAAASTDPTARRNLARALGNRGELLRKVGRTAESTAVLQSAADLYLAVADGAGDDEARRSAATTLMLLGMSFRELGRRDDAVRTCERSLALFQKLQTGRPNDPRLLDGMSRVYGVIGYAHHLLTAQADGGREKSRAAYEEARRLAAAAMASDSKNPQYATAYGTATINLGILYLRLYDDPVKAKALYTEAMELYRRLTAEYPAEQVYQIALGNALGNLTNTVVGDEARRYREESRMVYEKALAVDPENARLITHHASSLISLAEMDRSTGHQDQALKLCRQAVAQFRRVYDRDPNDFYNRDWLTSALVTLGQIYLTVGHMSDARSAFDEAASLAETFLKGQGSGHVKYVERLSDAYGGQAAVFRLEKNPAAAAEINRKQLELWGKQEKASKHFYALAKDFAACVPLAATDAERLAYADAALDALRKAVTAGFTDAAALAAEGSFVPLRDRIDFKSLLSGLQK